PARGSGGASRLPFPCFASARGQRTDRRPYKAPGLVRVSQVPGQPVVTSTGSGRRARRTRVPVGWADASAVGICASTVASGREAGHVPAAHDHAALVGVDAWVNVVG